MTAHSETATKDCSHPRSTRSTRTLCSAYVLVEQWSKRCPSTPTFIVVGFLPGVRGQLKAGSPQQFKAAEKALAAADRLLGRYARAAVLEQLPDEFAEPRLVKAVGELPAGFEESLAA